MEQDFVNRMKVELETQKERIVASIADQETSLKKLITSEETGDDVDAASNVIDSSLLSTLSAQDKSKLELIDSALDRIKHGTYGLCLMCKKEIPRPRLEAMPYAYLCIKCKGKQEGRR